MSYLAQNNLGKLRKCVDDNDPIVFFLQKGWHKLYMLEPTNDRVSLKLSLSSPPPPKKKLITKRKGYKKISHYKYYPFLVRYYDSIQCYYNTTAVKRHNV